MAKNISAQTDNKARDSPHQNTHDRPALKGTEEGNVASTQKGSGKMHTPLPLINRATIFPTVRNYNCNIQILNHLEQCAIVTRILNFKGGSMGIVPYCCT